LRSSLAKLACARRGGLNDTRQRPTDSSDEAKLQTDGSGGSRPRRSDKIYREEMTSYRASESGNRRAAAMRALKRSADGLVVVAGSAQGRANQ